MLMFHNEARVKSYSSSSRSGKHTLKVEIEYSDAYELAYDMQQLDEALAARKVSRARKPAATDRGQKSIEQKPTLALPAPEDE